MQIDLAALEADPYPIYRRVRDEQPVAWVEAVGLWFVTRWDDVARVAQDPERVTAAVDGSPLERTLGRNVLTYTRGAYAAAFPPGGWSALGAALAAPLGPLHWAGSETAERWYGYMEGAVLAGRRAAREVAGASPPPSV